VKTPRPVAAALAIVVGAGLLLTPTSVLAGADQDLYARGRDAVFAEKWSEARDAFEDLIRRQPGSAYADDAHYWLGMAYYESREPERGYSILKQLQSRFPDSPWNDDGRSAGQQPGTDSHQQFDKQRLLVGEVSVDRRTADADSGSDILQSHRKVTALGDKAFGRGDQLAAAIRFGPAAPGGGRRRHRQRGHLVIPSWWTTRLIVTNIP